MTIAQYEEVRRDSRLFLVSPGHVLPEIEDVTYRETGFAVCANATTSPTSFKRLTPAPRPGWPVLHPAS